MESSSEEEEEEEDAGNDDSNDEEELEVVDFNDMAKLFEPAKKPKKTSPKKSSRGREVVEKQFIGGLTNDNPSPSLHRPQHSLTDINTITKMMDETLSPTEKSLEDGVAPGDVVEPSLFYTSTQPAPIPAETTLPSNPFPSDEFDDDVIVYVAPHPRKGVQTSPEKQPLTNGGPDTSEFTPYVRDASLALALASSSSTTTAIEQQSTQPQPPTPSLSSFSFSFATPEGKTRGRLSVPPVTIPRLAISWKRRKNLLGKKGRKPRNSFGAYGAMREEAQLHDPREKERRRGDSDLDWGDTDSDDHKSGNEHDDTVERVDGVTSPSGLVNGNDNEKVDDKGKGKAREVEDNEHGMEVDSDLDLSSTQLKQFVAGLLGKDAGRHVTMDDLRDNEEQVRLENERDTGEEDDMSVNESSEDDEDPEIERVLADEEAMFISETLDFEDGDEIGDEDEDEDDISEDDDEDGTPRTSFQKRLERLRRQATSSKHDNEYHISDDDDDDLFERYMLFAENSHEAKVSFSHAFAL